MRRMLIMLGLALLTAGCGQRMGESPKRNPLDHSPMFANGAAARPPVAGTVAQDDGAATRPAVLDLGLLQHGRERFEIFCSPCQWLCRAWGRARRAARLSASARPPFG